MLMSSFNKLNTIINLMKVMLFKADHDLLYSDHFYLSHYDHIQLNVTQGTCVRNWWWGWGEGGTF